MKSLLIISVAMVSLSFVSCNPVPDTAEDVANRIAGAAAIVAAGAGATGK